MIRRFGLALGTSLFALLSFMPLAVTGQEAPTATRAPDAETKAPQTSIRVGYVELADDPRYANQGAYSGIQFFTLARPYTGAEVGLDEANDVGRLLDTTFTLERYSGTSVAEFAEKLRQWAAAGTQFILADLPAEILVEVSDAISDQPLVIFNISAPDDVLRGEMCRANVLHTFPSHAMLADALSQYLALKNWRRILVLQGPLPDDAKMVEAFRRSAQKFGLRIVDERQALLSNDPNRREQSNIALLTEGVDYDVVYVADNGFEIGRYVPYQTTRPRPVVGSAGLVAEAWHWSWDQDAGAQLQHRYENKALPYRMNSGAMGAWEAMKAISSAAVRTRGGTFEEIRGYILSDRLNLDTVKGNPGSFRPWDHQLRQPILLARPDAVIARAPFKEFLHQTNDLDTLGIDAPETTCSF